MQIYYPENNNGSQFKYTNYERLMIYLNHKQYYPEGEMYMFLEENGLDPTANYNKETDYRKMHCALLEILESLTNNIDIFRTVDTEFATTTEAYNYLERRIQKLRQKIDDIPDEPNDSGRSADFTHMFVD